MACGSRASGLEGGDRKAQIDGNLSLFLCGSFCRLKMGAWESKDAGPVLLQCNQLCLSFFSVL